METFTEGLLIDKECMDQPEKSWEFCTQCCWCSTCPSGASLSIPKILLFGVGNYLVISGFSFFGRSVTSVGEGALSF